MPPRIIPSGPWTTCLDWDLHATYNGEIRRSFWTYVRPGRESPVSSITSFSRFLCLSLELQHHILSFCDDATFFQLMHVSFQMREEAKKLFWSDATTRYYIDGSWLLAGGFPGHTHADLDALKYMQHINVDFDHLSSVLVSGWEDCELSFLYDDGKDLPSNYAEQQIARFWTTVRRRFPCVTDVVLSDGGWEYPETPAPVKLTRLAEGCPNGISASVSRFHLISRHHAQESRHLWRPSSRDGSPITWELISPSWIPRSVLPPVKKFFGPVGTYLRRHHDWGDRYGYPYHARELLLIQATEAYYLHTRQTPCICPFPGCGLQFEVPGQWAAHYVSGDAAHEGDLPLPLCETLALRSSAMTRFWSSFDSGTKRNG